MCIRDRKFGMKLNLDTVTMKRLFGVVKHHSYIAMQPTPMLQSDRFLDRNEVQHKLKRSQIDSREDFAEDVAEALHSPEELARVRGQPPPAPSRAQKKRCKALYRIMDKNSDGDLSADEIAASFPQEWLDLHLDSMLMAQRSDSEGVDIETWVEFTRELVRSYGSAFVNNFLSHMLTNHLGALSEEQNYAGMFAFGAMDGDMSGTLDSDEIHEVFDSCFPEYLSNRPHSLVRVEKGCIDAYMWLLFLREVQHFEGEQALTDLLKNVESHAFTYDDTKEEVYKEFTGPLYSAAIAHFVKASA
eukprot:TRINITY_DN29557_c0_g2_i4.p1 TRINITY_DN29557_c0_g2~~TRINITY_DN29557_c0_g2_i4.p1  ORF type:complete len:301 (-),score=79.64 TRINITY_DN29557_c0_g2_i4:193-1095(-)